MSNPLFHRVNVREKPVFLHRLMRELAGKSTISLEGDLSQTQPPEDLIVRYDRVAALHRNTMWPKQDFIVLQLAPEHVGRIYEQVMAAGLKRAIIHVQIERKGVLELAAYDNFHPDCTTTGPGVSVALLYELKAAKVVRDFEAVK